MSHLTEDVLLDVIAERKRQDWKWGEQNHDPETWLAVLIEEVGEVGKAILEMSFPSGEAVDLLDLYRLELIQVAAVAVAAIESHDRAITKRNEIGRH
jgi:NTP pyrophosphatase (non-canonical NTP hydrolase)